MTAKNREKTRKKLTLPMEEVEGSVVEILRRAAEIYEGSPATGLAPQPFFFVLDEDQNRVKTVPVAVNVHPDVIVQLSRTAPKALEGVALEFVQASAAQVPPCRLVAVGYVFPARGDFPQNEMDEAITRLLRAQGAEITPWSREGVVMVVDHPGARVTWGCLRGVGEVADPLSAPAKMVVRADHVPHLYPFILQDEPAS